MCSGSDMHVDVQYPASLNFHCQIFYYTYMFLHDLSSVLYKFNFKAQTVHLSDGLWGYCSCLFWRIVFCRTEGKGWNR